MLNLNLNQHLYEKSYNDILERERILNPESNLILEKNSVYIIFKMFLNDIKNIFTYSSNLFY